MLERFPLRSPWSSAPLIRYDRARRLHTSFVTRRDLKKWSDTLLLPTTTLPLKHRDPVSAEARYRSRTTDQLYRQQWTENDGRLAILHDGPPYANGHLHMGHALNKILKDIINRYNVIRGRKVHYVPGWDCHGLPIEHKALQAIGKSHTAMSVSAVRDQARATAREAIDIQKNEFRSLAIMADWDSPDGVYITMRSDYEARQLKLFQKMVEQGHITHRLRPTYYSPSSRTALAESELSYKDGHKSRSVYVGFPVDREDMSPALRSAYDKVTTAVGTRLPLSLAVWTTTAWTLPANAGVNVGGDMSYIVAKTVDDRLIVLAEARLEPMKAILGELHVLAEIMGPDLVGTRYSHTFQPKSESKPLPSVFISPHVTAESGTGLVHSAPAHGHDDYMAFSKAGLLPDVLRCPVDDDGCLTEEVVDWAETEDARELVGKSVLGDAVPAVIDLLRKQGVLLAEETIEHRYPHDWKSKEPVIVRATPQWFADVDAIKPRAMQALQAVDFYPPQSRNRLEAFVTSRSEWCISRQRSWGVPIPALYEASGAPLLDIETISHVVQVLAEKGTDHWWDGPVEDFVPSHLAGRDLRKGTDTLDVWFDSGSSWTLLEHETLRRTEHDALADVYLEGSDQHRGWFQSSLLTKLGVGAEEVKAPYQSIISHGFVMDEEGNKMSKSAGNGLSPVEVASGTKDKKGYGADTLRLWAASVDYTKDVSIGPSAIGHASETLRKTRSAMRFLLANSHGHDAPALDDLELGWLDRYVLHELSVLERDALHCYDSFALNRVLQSTTTFISTTLSAFYFDAIKDTLYCQPTSSPDRLAAIATLREVFRVVRQIIAPIAPHLAEELYEHDPSATRRSSVFLDTWKAGVDRRDEQLDADMKELLVLRTTVNQLVEELREPWAIKTSDEIVLDIAADNECMRALGRYETVLPQLLGVSHLRLCPLDGLDGRCRQVELRNLGTVRITCHKTEKRKCGRCWKHRANQEDELCPRCLTVVSGRW